MIAPEGLVLTITNILEAIICDRFCLDSGVTAGNDRHLSLLTLSSRSVNTNTHGHFNELYMKMR